tara:strand:- start:4218 stop:7001 length:2784 start_codon:yes stop_codon:yes gene_type:complete
LSQLETSFVNQLCSDIDKINGTDFEYFCKTIISLILDCEIQHKGHNLFAKPVKSTADFNSIDFDIVGQCGTDRNYFEKTIKPLKDIDGAIKNHPQCKIIYLFANNRASGGQLSKLSQEIQNRGVNQTVEVFDSERIAKEVLLNNIHKSKVLALIKKYTPFAYKQFELLPNSNSVPIHTSNTYYERNEEEEIIDILKKNKLVQIYGLSGIGKSELSKSITLKLTDDFDTIIWVNGDDINNVNFDFESVYISRFESKINLAVLLKNTKIVLVLDNFNENVSQIEKQFKTHNQSNSVCVVTSLQKNITDSYQLNFVCDKLSRQILNDSDSPPNNDIASQIIKYVGGFPLVLSIIRDEVKNGEDDWNDLLDDLKDVVNIADPDKNIKISVRVLERSLGQIEEELRWIYVLDTRFISVEFLKFAIKRSGINSLLSRSLISKNETSHYSVHQIIIDSINKIFGNKKFNHEFHVSMILEYLSKENEVKSVGYYSFVSHHKKFLNKLYGNSNIEILRKHILYSLIQGGDQNEYFLREIEKFALDGKDKISILLQIEHIEIELITAKKLHKKNNNQLYKNICEIKLKIFENLIAECVDPEIEIYLKHHLGKLYIRLEKLEPALHCFDEVLEKDPNADYARLQIARIAVWHDTSSKLVTHERLNKIIKLNLSRKNQWDKSSLSVLLATYELISEYKMSEFRGKYIDSCIDDFVSNLMYSMSFGFEQPFDLLSKLSSHLGYNFKEHFFDICSNLPFPSTIETNESVQLSFAKIQSAFCRQLKYSNISDKKDRINRAFNNAEIYYKNIKLEDFERGKFIDLYIDRENYLCGLKEIEKYDNKVDDPFYFQKYCKLLRLRGEEKDIEQSLKCIDTAIEIASNNPKFTNYKTAFLNDKAESMLFKSTPSAIELLKEAIELQKNNKTVKSWNYKLERWQASLH